MAHTKRIAAAVAIGAITILLSGCVGDVTVAETSSARSASPTAASPAVEPSAAATEPAQQFDDVLAERQAFFEAQQLPLDGSLLAATTPQQKDFISQQKAYVEANGGTWSAGTESITLALAADACETSILNGHKVDQSRFETHILTSPLFAELIPESVTGIDRTTAERNVASIMVFGTGFLCPADADQWETEFLAAYPG